ncbi:MAG: hypothetical protein ABJM29_14705 [Rhizobiaceae bacterium]
MEQSVEKSCWGITLWAIAIVLALVLIGSFVMGSSTDATATASLTVSLDPAHQLMVSKSVY